MKAKEMASAAAVGLCIFAVYALGFRFRIIHTVMAGAMTLGLAFFPIWIVLEYSRKEI